jgi:hypothetical protein
MSTPNAGASASAPPATPSPTNSEAPKASESPSAEGVDASDVLDAPEGEAVKEALKPKDGKKKFKIKVDSKEEEVELDVNDEDEVRKHLQMSKAAYKRMQEMAEYKKGVSQLLETLKNDPIKVLADPRLGIPDEVRKKLAESIINNEIEEMQKTPEQKEKERLQREYEALKKQHEDEKKSREDEKFRMMQEQAAKELDGDITSAIESSGMPKTARTVKIMAEAMMFCLENNLDLSAKDLVPYVKKQTLGEFKEMISSLPDEEFESWLGKDQISRIRKRQLAKVKQSAPTTSQVKQTGEASKTTEPQKKIPLKDFMKGLGKF